MTDIYNEIKEAEYVKRINDILKDIWPNIIIFENLPIIPENAPPTPESAYIARKLAFEDIKDHQEKNTPIPIKDSWQHYWFKCCTSDKCDFIFKFLKSKGIDRENDLKKICSSESELFHALDNDAETKQFYIDLCIGYLLKRYNIFDSKEMWKNSPKKNPIIRLQISLPRLIASILVGSIVIATSSEIYKFVSSNQPFLLLLYSLALLVLSYGYLTFECLKITQGTIITQIAKKRACYVLKMGTSYSLVISFVFLIIGLFQVSTNSETGFETFFSYILSYTSQLFFYATFSLFIGIVVQLLWEEKTVSEPF